MRVSRQQAAENRKRIVRTAGELFREKGYDGIGVADLMKAAGLTHGGFYGHFKSKEDLAAQAVAEALDSGAERWRGRISARPEARLAAIVDYYLSDDHRDKAGLGCPIAALASDTSRQGQTVKDAYGRGAAELIAILAETMPDKDPEARRQNAVLAFTAMVGAVMLSRAIGDRELSDEVLVASRKFLANPA